MEGRKETEYEKLRREEYMESNRVLRALRDDREH